MLEKQTVTQRNPLSQKYLLIYLHLHLPSVYIQIPLYITREIYVIY